MTTRETPLPHDPPPERIGPYRVLEQLGSGGMGSVYLAEQREPIHRRVAIKVIKLGMDTRQVLARFEAERQAMALMSHPGIAKVYDAGSTDDGRPYFVMEHIEGTRITRYADRQRLSIERRIELMISLCEAIQHAHQKGVIHRDIKPSNVLIREIDGETVATVIDFGIAKASMGQSLTEQTLYTESGVILGTPEYMSPEQARRDEVRVDTRTDVYSLGALLYELLTGVLPFDADTLRGADGSTMLDILNEREPRNPSTRVALLADGDDATREAIAQSRSTDLPDLRRQLKGDLDWVVRKAIEKDPGRRYATPFELAADLRAHLDHEPVSAGPPGVRYRLGKLVRRHRLAAIALAAVVITLGTGFAASLAFWLDARSAQRASEAANSRAQADYQRAIVAVDAMFDAIGDPRLTGLPRIEPLRREFLERSLELYQNFLSIRTGDPALIRRNALAFGNLAYIRDLLGETELAEADTDAGIALLRSLLDNPKARPSDIDFAHSELCKLLRTRGDLYGKTDRRALSEAAFLEAIQHYESCTPKKRATMTTTVQGAAAFNALGSCLSLSAPDRSEAAFRRAISILRERTAEQSSSDARRHLGTSLCNLSLLMLSTSRPSEAEPLLAEALDNAVQQERDERESHGAVTTETLNQLALIHGNRAQLLANTSRRAEAVIEFETALPYLREIERRSPDLVANTAKIGRIMTGIGAMRMVLSETEVARDWLEQAIEVFEGLDARFPGVSKYRVGIARALSHIGRSYLIDHGRSNGSANDLRRLADTEAARGIEILESHLAAHPDDLQAQGLNAQLLLQRSDYAFAAEDLDRALEFAQTVQDTCGKLNRRFPTNRSYINGLTHSSGTISKIHERRGELQLAIDALDIAIAAEDSRPDIESSNYLMRVQEGRRIRRGKLAEELATHRD